MLTRQEAIRAIRVKILDLVDDDHSMCRVASEKNIYCRGFRQFTDEGLRERYAWLVRRNPNMGREELEDLANRWQLARQIVDSVPVSCDAQALEHDTCSGWEGFGNETLSRYYREMVGDEVTVID